MSLNASIRVDGRGIDIALKDLKKATASMFREQKFRRVYQKPSEARRRKSKRAQARLRRSAQKKAEAEQRMMVRPTPERTVPANRQSLVTAEARQRVEVASRAVTEKFWREPMRPQRELLV